MKHDSRFNINLGDYSTYEHTMLQTLSYTVYRNSLYFWGLKVSSRVMDERATQLELETSEISFIRNIPINARALQVKAEQVDNIFLLTRNGQIKLYTGILEVSKFKTAVSINDGYETSWKPGYNLEKYQAKLQTYLELTYDKIAKGGMLDGHHSKYNQSLYYLLKLLPKEKVYLIDIDHQDFHMIYDILRAKEYTQEYYYRPKLHTNEYGYSIVESMLLNNLDTEWGQFWYTMAQSELTFYNLLKKRIPIIGRQEYEKLI